MPKRKGWRGGIIRGGVYWIDKNNHRDRFSTGIEVPDEGAANAFYENWLNERRSGSAGAGEDPDFGTAITAYLTHSAAKNSAKYVRSQGGAFKRWLLFLQHHQVFRLRQLTAALVADFIPWRKNGGRVVGPDGTELFQLLETRKGRKNLRQPRVVEAAAVNRDFVAMSNLYTWHRETGRLPDSVNPFAKISQIREDKEVRPHRMVPLRELVHARAHLIPKWADLTTVLLGTAFRYESGASVGIDDISEHRSVVRDPHPKGKVAVEVTVDKEVLEAAIRCATIHAPYPDDEAQQYGRRLTSACARAGVTRFTAHDIRVTAATLMYEAGVPLKTLQRLLAHKNLRTTERYVRSSQDDAPKGLSITAMLGRQTEPPPTAEPARPPRRVRHVKLVENRPVTEPPSQPAPSVPPQLLLGSGAPVPPDEESKPAR